MCMFTYTGPSYKLEIFWTVANSPLRFTLGTKTCAIFPQQDGCRPSENDKCESEQAIAPSIPDIAIHGRGEYRKGKPCDTSKKLGGSARRCNVLAESIHDIGLQSLRVEDDAAAKDRNADIWNYPVIVFLC